ncbi:MAG TPA: Hsp20/alpha crystallin family protein [Acetobacteraceae bacterium]|nr:Hsp20/alpha crystallin family protein [Acetobacteraceae bacterium]
MPTIPVPVNQNQPARNVPDAWQAFRTEMDRLFDRFTAGLGMPPFNRMFDVAPVTSFAMPVPAVDVSEDETSYKIAAELPGLADKDIEVTLANGLLTLKGEKRQETDQKDKNYYLSERSYGMFRRSFAVPDGIDADKAVAQFTNGVLTVTLPKTAAAQRAEKKIAVKAAA